MNELSETIRYCQPALDWSDLKLHAIHWFLFRQINLLSFKVTFREYKRQSPRRDWVESPIGNNLGRAEQWRMNGRWLLLTLAGSFCLASRQLDKYITQTRPIISSLHWYNSHNQLRGKDPNSRYRKENAKNLKTQSNWVTRLKETNLNPKKIIKACSLEPASFAMCTLGVTTTLC